MNKISVERKTAESLIFIGLDFGSRDLRAKERINTGLPFFDHMLEQIAWRGEFNLDVKVELDHFALNHVVCEDVGITMGKAIQEYIKRNVDAGVIGYGFAYGTIDEALSRATFSFESRAYLDLTWDGVEMPESTEGIKSEDLVAFWEGFVQGAQCTLHLDILKGRAMHGHHHWESAFRAAAQALREAIQVRTWRQGMAAGVANQIQFVVRED